MGALGTQAPPMQLSPGVQQSLEWLHVSASCRHMGGAPQCIEGSQTVLQHWSLTLHWLPVARHGSGAQNALAFCWLTSCPGSQ